MSLHQKQLSASNTVKFIRENIAGLNFTITVICNRIFSPVIWSNLEGFIVTSDKCLVFSLT